MFDSFSHGSCHARVPLSFMVGIGEFTRMNPLCGGYCIRYEYIYSYPYDGYLDKLRKWVIDFLLIIWLLCF